MTVSRLILIALGPSLITASGAAQTVTFEPTQPGADGVLVPVDQGVAVELQEREEHGALVGGQRDVRWWAAGHAETVRPSDGSVRPVSVEVARSPPELAEPGDHVEGEVGVERHGREHLAIEALRATLDEGAPQKAATARDQRHFAG